MLIGNTVRFRNDSIAHRASVIAVLFFITGAAARPATAAPCADDLPPIEAVDHQKALVAALATHLEGAKKEERVGQRQLWEMVRVYEDYYDAAEVLSAMEQCSADQGKTTLATLLESRIKTASERRDALALFARAAKDRWTTGEITQADLSWAEAHAIKAEIRLMTLESRAKRK